MTDAEKRRKGINLAELLLEEAKMFDQEFQHREMALEARYKALGVLAAMRDMGLLSVSEWRNRVYMAERKLKETETGERRSFDSPCGLTQDDKGGSLK